MTAWRLFRLTDDNRLTAPVLTQIAVILNDGPTLHPGPCPTGRHTRPTEHCQCGLYYVRDRRKLARYYPAVHPEERVFADVTPLGTTWTTPTDWYARRAEALRLNGLWVLQGTSQHRKDALYERYQVPVLHWKAQPRRPRKTVPARYAHRIPTIRFAPPKETA